MFVHILERLFNRKDVQSSAPIDRVDHRRERRRLPGAGRTCDEHEAMRQVDNRVDYRWQPEGLERRDDVRDQTERDGQGVALIERVGPNAGIALPLEAEVDLAVLVERAALVLIDHRED